VLVNWDKLRLGTTFSNGSERYRMAKIQDVAVIVGSLRKGSLNRQVANALAELSPATLKLNIIETGHLPIYNQDGDENPPDAWTEFRDRIKAADAVLSSLRPSIIVRSLPR
jgi:hypothetical protein